jgi:hypothetical protein
MDEEEVTPEPTPEWVLEADRAHKRYEIARAVLAAMMPAAHDVCQTFDFKLRARAAVEAADALLAALEGE